MKYLGIPLNDTKLCMCAFSYITEKVAKHVPPWKRKNMSSVAARFSLIVAWLACQPTQCAFICYLLVPTEEWTPLDPDSFEEGQKETTNTTWLSGRQFVGQNSLKA
jgi:hypothetical protein